jgi:hypothetical protein
VTGLAPEHGVRILLELVRGGRDSAIYRVELHSPRGAWAGEASFDEMGTPVVGVLERLDGMGDPEPWMLDTVRSFLRTLHRNHAAEGNWPSRMLRWRERRS